MVRGTLKYVTGYTGFSGTEAQQSGHYLVLHCEAASETADRITVQIINGENTSPVELDEDGIIILRIKDKDRQAVNITLYDGNTVVSRLLNLSGLVLEPEE